MKMRKAYLVIVILLLGNKVCAQYAPGAKVPAVNRPVQNYYDWEHGSKGFVRMLGLGADTPADQNVIPFLQEIHRMNALEFPLMERYLFFLLLISSLSLFRVER